MQEHACFRPSSVDMVGWEAEKLARSKSSAQLLQVVVAADLAPIELMHTALNHSDHSISKTSSNYENANILHENQNYQSYQPILEPPSNTPFRYAEQYDVEADVDSDGGLVLNNIDSSREDSNHGNYDDQQIAIKSSNGYSKLASNGVE